MDTSTIWWHGGANGLAVGDWILPAADLPDLPAIYSADIYAQVADRTRVYITNDKAFARAAASFNAQAAGGTLYRVDPDGPLQEDPDFAGLGVAYTASRARIVEVCEIHPRVTSRAYTRSTGRFQRWDDGGPVYDIDGFLLPSPTARAAGVTAALTRRLGQWVPLDVAEQVLQLDRQGLRWTPEHVAAAIAEQDRVLKRRASAARQQTRALRRPAQPAV